MLKKRMISIITFVLVIILSLALFGCKEESSTVVPTELREKWYSENPELADFNFTENRYFSGNSVEEYLVRVTGKKIEAQVIDKPDKWVIVCESYNISSDVLTFTGGYRNRQSFNKNKVVTTSVPKELKGKWYYLDDEEQFITFTENRLNMHEVNLFIQDELPILIEVDDEHSVRIAGKTIEIDNVGDPVKWDIFCQSYTISGDVLIFTGGIADKKSYSILLPSELKERERLASLNKLKKTFDDILGVAWYHNPYFTHYDNTNLISIYISAKKGRTPSIILRITCCGNKLIHFENAYISYESNTKEIDFDYFSDYDLDIANSCEKVEVVNPVPLDFLRKFAQSNDTKVGLYGERNEKKKFN